MSSNKVRRRPKKKAERREEQACAWESIVMMLFSRVAEDVQWDGDVKKVKGAIRARDWQAVLAATKACPPQLYADWRKYYAACQVEHLFKKLPIPGSDQALREAAFGTLMSDEWRNRRTNQRFRILYSRAAKTGYFDHKNPLYGRLMRSVQRFIAATLGDSPVMEAIYARCNFGPGSCVGVGGDSTHAYAKLDALTCTDAALQPFRSAVWDHAQFRSLFLPGRQISYRCPITRRREAFDVVCEDPEHFREEFSRWVKVVDYNKIDFVPKNAMTHRTTASEPSGNGWLQAGIGEEMASLLRERRPWLNHRDQTRNQRLAKLGSQEHAKVRLATIDLKSSSQSIATQMVKVAFSMAPGWFDLMNRTRSPNWQCTLRPGMELRGRYELIASMGNGFCFPLQMVLYAAAIEACYREVGIQKGTYGVFGDDLIVEQSVALLLIEFLRFLGIRTNTDKTFVFGPFRESCGADFWDGVNVRPYVLDSLPDTGQQLVKVANGIHRRTPFPLWGAWWGLWYKLPKYARDTIRPYEGPDDAGLISPTIGFYDVWRLDEYDRDLQRYAVRSLRSVSVPDTGTYVSKRSGYGQMFVALRGALPEMQQRVESGREAALTAHLGTPTPSFRRKTKLLTVTL